MGYWGGFDTTLGHGKTKIVFDSWVVPVGTPLTTYHTTTNRGVLKSVEIVIGAIANAEQAVIGIFLDDTQLLPGGSGLILNGSGYDVNTRPIMITDYQVGGPIQFTYLYESGVRFDDTLKVKMSTIAGLTVSVNCYILYEERGV